MKWLRRLLGKRVETDMRGGGGGAYTHAVGAGGNVWIGGGGGGPAFGAGGAGLLSGGAGGCSAGRISHADENGYCIYCQRRVFTEGGVVPYGACVGHEMEIVHNGAHYQIRRIHKPAAGGSG